MFKKVISSTLAAVLIGGAMLGVTAGRSLADGSGTVSVTLQAENYQAPAPCLVMGRSSMDFGQNLAFAAPGNVSAYPFSDVVNPFGGFNFTYTSCSTGNQDVLAHGTDLTGAHPILPGSATWALTNHEICTGALDQYGLTIKGQGGLQPASPLALLTNDQTVRSSVAPNAQGLFDYSLKMPCQGSSGADFFFTGSLVFTAVLS